VTLDLTMETSDRKIILKKITEVEQRIARLQKQQEEAETILKSLREYPLPERRSGAAHGSMGLS